MNILEIETLRESLGEETTQKLELMEINEKLNKENYMLKESCENFVQVERNLHKKIYDLEESKNELFKVLDDLTLELTKLELTNISEYKSYLKALKILSKYEKAV